MTNVRLAVLTALFAAAVPALYAERILIPVALQTRVAGSHGSLWAMDLLAVNTGAAPAMIHNVETVCGPIGASCPTGGWIPSHETVSVQTRIDNDRNAAVIRVEPAEKIVFELRVRDLSRQAETWGTELPAIPENDFFTGELTLLDVPIADGFRNTLRLYEIDGTPNAGVRIRIYRIRPADLGATTWIPDELLGEVTVPLIPPPASAVEWTPAYAEIGDLRTIFPTLENGRVRLQITSTDPQMRFWGFASVTNNATQHVTTITPR